MTDITTTNLKQLLDEAAPGPWESSASEYGVPEGWDEYWLALHMGYTRLSTMERDDPPPEEAYASLNLAALAPELAQEVIRLRDGVEQIREMCLLERDAAFKLTPTHAAFNICAEQLTALLDGEEE